MCGHKAEESVMSKKRPHIPHILIVWEEVFSNLNLEPKESQLGIEPVLLNKEMLFIAVTIFGSYCLLV